MFLEKIIDYKNNTNKGLRDQEMYPNFPRNILLLCLVFTITLVGLVFFIQLNLANTLKETIDIDIELEELNGKVGLYDEILTMSSRMAVFTGDKAWIERYIVYEPKLDDTINEIISLSPKDIFKEKIKKTGLANIELVKLEKKAISYIQQGDLEKARYILFSDEYKNYKSIYSSSLDEFIKELKLYFSKKKVKAKEIEYYFVATVAFIFIVIFVLWYYIISLLIDWQKRLSVTLEALSKSNSDLERFAYAASHDMKEPLRTINSFVQLLERSSTEKLSKDEKEYLTFIKSRVHYLRDLISDLLNYSLIDKRLNKFGDVDTNEVLKYTLGNLGEAINRSEVEIKSKKLPVVQGDRTLLSQVFHNLIHNAIKYKKHDEKLVLEISCNDKDKKNGGKEYVFKFKDNGVGIDKDNIEKIFDLFARLQSKDKNHGNGIGLALYKKAIEYHRGSIWVESEKGEGSAFYFSVSL